MARTARSTADGVTHHVMARGIERRRIFVDDHDRYAMLDRLARVLQAAGVTCYAWALMPNHIHLVVRSESVPISRLMARIGTSYALYFNRRHERVGHLFQNRFRSRLVVDDADLTGLVRYVHLNPLAGGIVQTLEELETHRWCGHAALVGRAAAEPFHAVDAALALFGADPVAALADLGQWIREGWERGLPAEPLEPEAPARGSSPLVLGADADWECLVARVCQRFAVGREELRSPARRRALTRARAVLTHLAVDRLGLSVCEVAARLGMSPGATSRAAGRGRSWVAKAGAEIW